MFVTFAAICVGGTVCPSVVSVFTSHCVDLVVCVVLDRCLSDMFLPSDLVGQDTLSCGAPSRMADRRADNTVSTSGRFWTESLMSSTAICAVYESANAGSDRRDFSVGSVARSIDFIAVVQV